MQAKHEKTEIALNQMRSFLNGDDQRNLPEWISWLISLLGKDHTISKRLEPLLYKRFEENELRSAIYDIITDET